MQRPCEERVGPGSAHVGASELCADAMEREMARIGLTSAGEQGFRQPITLFRTPATSAASFRANGRLVALGTSAIVLAAPGLGEYWLRSDHAALALRGVPAWFGGLDGEVIGKPKGRAERQLATTRTHMPDDERKPTWDLSGAVFEVKFLAELGIRAAESDTPPVWTVDSAFKRASDALRGIHGHQTAPER